jgi:hypothetical protein
MKTMDWDNGVLLPGERCTVGGLRFSMNRDGCLRIRQGRRILLSVAENHKGREGEDGLIVSVPIRRRVKRSRPA